MLFPEVAMPCFKFILLSLQPYFQIPLIDLRLTVVFYNGFILVGLEVSPELDFGGGRFVLSCGTVLFYTDAVPPAVFVLQPNRS